LAGGAGYLGRRIALKLVRDFNANVVLLGRSPLANVAPILDSIQAEAGHRAGSVTYRQCDLTRLPEVQEAVSETRTRFGTLHGVVSLVTDHRDAFLFNKTWTDFYSVQKGKVEGTINLDLATQEIDLDFFSLFSSQAALGMAGASDYAYGCEF